MSEDFNLAMMGNSRVFLQEGRGRPDHEPTYMGCMRAGAASQSFGDITRIECESPDEYNQFDVITEVQGSEEPPTASLIGRFALDVTSTLLRLGKRRCPADLHIHFGACQNPQDFDAFSKAVIIEWARIPTWSTDDLGASASGDNNIINETADVSGRNLYEVVQLSFAAKGADVVVNPLEDVVICSKRECGDCDDSDDGCQVIFAVGDAQPGSPGTAPDLIWSINSGQTLNADDIHSLDSSEDADALACLKEYVVVVSNADAGIHYKTKANIVAGTPWLWTRNATGIVAGGEPNDIWSVGLYAFIVGDGGYVYGTANPVAGVTVLDAGVATTQNLNAVHALNKKFAVAVGESGAIVKTSDGLNWSAVTGPTGVADGFTCVWLKDKKNWLIGSDAGGIYYTVDGGENWTTFTDVPVTFTAIHDIAFSTNNVGYLAGAIAGPAGVILRTYNGGNSWVSLPEGVSSLPANDKIDAIAACKYDANFVVGVGLADDAQDGIFLVGTE
jgi:photosystem II stability/assembly factor-like uncharacterized protein